MSATSELESETIFERDEAMIVDNAKRAWGRPHIPTALIYSSLFQFYASLTVLSPFFFPFNPLCSPHPSIARFPSFFVLRFRSLNRPYCPSSTSDRSFVSFPKFPSFPNNRVSSRPRAANRPSLLLLLQYFDPLSLYLLEYTVPKLFQIFGFHRSSVRLRPRCQLII
jgi:hypothetical protein